MNSGTWVRRGAALALVVAVGGGGFAFAQGAASPSAATAAGPGYYGPGMMYRYHQGAMGPGAMYGYGQRAGGYGMGPGMMGGYGTGPGCMGGYGMGPGMMYGYGMGPGMLGAWGMGSGLTGGYGGLGGMHGFLGGWAGHALGLSSAQRDKIDAIRMHTFKAAWPLMGELLEQRFEFARLSAAAAPDQAAIDKAYDRIGALGKQLLDLRLQARKDLLDVLTAAQRKQLEALHRGYWY